MPKEKPFPPEFKAEAVRLYRANSGRSIQKTAAEIGISHKTLRSWIKQEETDEGTKAGIASKEREELKTIKT
jgi:transposase-like protein